MQMIDWICLLGTVGGITGVFWGSIDNEGKPKLKHPFAYYLMFAMLGVIVSPLGVPVTILTFVAAGLVSIKGWAFDRVGTVLEREDQ